MKQITLWRFYIALYNNSSSFLFHNGNYVVFFDLGRIQLGFNKKYPEFCLDCKGNETTG